jgi:hypothetical protein
MAPLDALTEARIRSLEIVVTWLMEQSILPIAERQKFSDIAMTDGYILDFAEKVVAAQEEQDA